MIGRPRSRLAQLLAASAIVAVASNAAAQEFEMTIATIVPEDLTNNEIWPGLVHFKSLVESRTDGEMAVTLFGNSQLGSEVETGSQVQGGGAALQSTVMSSGAMSSFYDKYQAVTTPFLFDNWRQAWTFFDGEWFADFMEGTIEEAELCSLVAGSYTSTVAVNAAEEALQMHGCNGMTWEYPLHLFLKRAKADELILGHAAAQRRQLAPLIDITLD